MMGFPIFFGNRITAIADDSNGGKVQWRKPGKHSGQQEKFTDYLTYRNEVTDAAGSGGGYGQKEQQKYESVCDSDGHGFNSHACQ